MKCFILILLSCACISSCQKIKTQKIITKTVSPIPLESRQLTDSIWHGYTDAYIRMKAIYIQKGYFPEIIFYSLMMADKYQYTPAYFDVYLCLWHAFNDGKPTELWDMTRFDPKSRRMALYYLGQAAKSGNKQAKEILIKQYE